MPAAAKYPNTKPAAAANQRYAAERAVGNPAKLAQATRIVRLALARNVLTLADLAPSEQDGAA